MRDMQKILGALQSPVRREILALIWERELAAGDIAAAFEVTKPTISQHLAVLREAGLVDMTPTGTYRRYRARHRTLEGLHGALDHARKWLPADDIPERYLVDAATRLVVVASVDVATTASSTFAAFTDPTIFSRWMGVPITLDNRAFACTLEWGTRVRGTYDLVHPPELIVMRWDFDDDSVPLPGAETTAYLRVRERGVGTHVEVHQLVDNDTQAQFMEAAWGVVLGRLKSGVVAASDPDVHLAPRARRRKRRRSA